MKQKKTTKGTKRTIFIYILILVAFYVGIYIVPQVSDIFVETYSAEYGVLQVKDETTCLFVRDEKVYTADNSGSVERVISRGSLMRSGARIVNVGDEGYYSDMKGIVSYYYDGLEQIYTPENIDSIRSSTLKNIQESETSQVVTAPKESAAAGDVIFKIVDNQQWYLLCWIDRKQIEKYTEGAKITVDFLDGEDGKESTQIEMRISRLVPQGSETLVVLSCNRHYGDFDQYRIRECALITSNTSGILLETSSIVEEEGQKGVYVVDKLGRYNFTPIRILDQDGDVTVAEKNYFYNAEGYSVATVKNYDEILRPQAEEESAEEKGDAEAGAVDAEDDKDSAGDGKEE